jgi:hypothetical protein
MQPHHMELLTEMLQSHAVGKDLCLIGERGAGKSFIARHFARATGYAPIESVFIYADMTSRDLLQRRAAGLSTSLGGSRGQLALCPTRLPSNIRLLRTRRYSLPCSPYISSVIIHTAQTGGLRAAEGAGAQQAHDRREQGDAVAAHAAHHRGGHRPALRARRRAAGLDRWGGSGDSLKPPGGRLTHCHTVWHAIKPPGRLLTHCHTVWHAIYGGYPPSFPEL